MGHKSNYSVNVTNTYKMIAVIYDPFLLSK